MKHFRKLSLLVCTCFLPSLIMASSGSQSNIIDVNELFSKKYSITISNIPDISDTKYKTFQQEDIIPSQTVGYHPDIVYLDRVIRVSAATGVDERILKCLLSQRFGAMEIKSARGQRDAKVYLNDNLHTWSKLLTRYEGDYQKMLEAFYYGTSSIDYLSERFGEDWYSHLGEIYIANGKIYTEEALEHSDVYSFSEDVLSYWEAR